MDLVKRLDADLAEKDGEEHSFFAQFNKLNTIKFVVLAYEHGKPLGCGAIKKYEPGTMESACMSLPKAEGKE